MITKLFRIEHVAHRLFKHIANHFTVYTQTGNLKIGLLYIGSQQLGQVFFFDGFVKSLQRTAFRSKRVCFGQRIVHRYLTGLNGLGQVRNLVSGFKILLIGNLYIMVSKLGFYNTRLAYLLTKAKIVELFNHGTTAKIAQIAALNLAAFVVAFQQGQQFKRRTTLNGLFNTVCQKLGHTVFANGLLGTRIGNTNQNMTGFNAIGLRLNVYHTAEYII